MKKVLLLLCSAGCTTALFAQTKITLGDTTVTLSAKQVSAVNRLTNDTAMQSNGRTVYYFNAGKTTMEIWTADFDNTNTCTDLRSYRIPFKNLDAGALISCQSVHDKTFAGTEQYVPGIYPRAGLDEFIDAVSYSSFLPHAQPYKENFCNVYFSTAAACGEFCKTLNNLLKTKQ